VRSEATSRWLLVTALCSIMPSLHSVPNTIFDRSLHMICFLFANPPPLSPPFRMRAAYHMKQVFQLTSTARQAKDDIVDVLGSQVDNSDHGELMCHEIAYVMGQLRDPRALPKLLEALGNRGNTCIVRHECAEAIGAIGVEEGLKMVECTGEDDEVRLSKERSLERSDS